MRSLITACILALTLIGCGTAWVPQHAAKTVIRSYKLGALTSISIGEPLISVQNASMLPAYEATRDYTPPQWNFWDGGMDYPPITKGMKFGIGAMSGDGQLQLLNRRYRAPVPGTVADSMVVEIPIFSSGIISDRPVRGGKYWTTDTLFQKSSEGYIEGDAFKAEIIYSGITGSTLKAVYREYINDYARPAFSTELQYNLDESKIVAYRSIKMEVIKATNSAIEYKVLSDDDLPWVK